MRIADLVAGVVWQQNAAVEAALVRVVHVRLRGGGVVLWRRTRKVKARVFVLCCCSFRCVLRGTGQQGRED